MTVHFQPKLDKGYPVTRLVRHGTLAVVHLTLPSTHPALSSSLSTGGISFKCKVSGMAESTKMEWEREHGMPSMQMGEDGRLYRFLDLSQGDVYLGSVNHRVAYGPRQGTSVSNERLALLVATALRWFSNRRGLANCVERLTESNHYFLCPISRPVYTPPPRATKPSTYPTTKYGLPLTGINEHYSIPDAIAVSGALEGVAGAVARAGVFLGFDARDLFAADALPVCEREAVRGLDTPDTLRSMKSVSSAGLSLYISTVESRDSWADNTRVLDDVYRVLSLTSKEGVSQSQAADLGRLVTQSSLRTSLALIQLRGLIPKVPTAFWWPVMQHWMQSPGTDYPGPGQSVPGPGLTFLSDLPTDTNPLECSAILDIAEECGMYNPYMSLYEVLLMPSLYHSGASTVLMRIECVQDLRGLRQEVPLRVVMGPHIDTYINLLPQLLTALDIADTIPVFTATLESMERTKGLLHALLEAQHVDGVYKRPIKQCIGLVRQLLAEAPDTAVSEVPALLGGSDHEGVVLVVEADTILFRHFLADPQLLGIARPEPGILTSTMVPSADVSGDTGVYTSPVNGSIRGSEDGQGSTAEWEGEESVCTVRGSTENNRSVQHTHLTDSIPCTVKTTKLPHTLARVSVSPKHSVSPAISLVSPETATPLSVDSHTRLWEVERSETGEREGQTEEVGEIFKCLVDNLYTMRIGEYMY
ncbi:hypothetical protein KIPB_003746 [Kipferlia bialata]|uniref:Ig-like domain-containing protein n=1 Tax=Kipferlia bialata TaxID=797122 RepID=A0A9K3CUJ9_9EUKA|nr:hypothetical protein KIPB_003746 [Kipferlia bialata]|eukprot:g3746.t1